MPSDEPEAVTGAAAPDPELLRAVADFRTSLEGDAPLPADLVRARVFEIADTFLRLYGDGEPAHAERALPRG